VKGRYKVSWDKEELSEKKSVERLISFLGVFHKKMSDVLLSKERKTRKYRIYAKEVFKCLLNTKKD